MVRTILKTIAYTKAPKTTFAVLHPAKAVSLKKMKWDMRHAYAPRVTALAVSALAIPLGMWMGRRDRLRALEVPSTTAPDAARTTILTDNIET